MNFHGAKKRVEKLRNLINKYRYQYHVENRLEISEDSLDSLKHELEKLEEEFPKLITPDSPTQRVAGKALAKFKKVEHVLPMLSLEDAFSEGDMKAWETRLEKILGRRNLEYFAELKFDGLALSLRYRDGVLALGATRGDGRIGEDITPNIKTIESVPLRLESYVKSPSASTKKVLAAREFEVRGEGIISKRGLTEINKIQKKRGGKIFANSRNLAAGTLRQLDPKIVAERRLEFFAYDLIVEGGPHLHSEEHRVLKELGFKADPFARVTPDLKDIFNFYEKVEKEREKFPYEIDGIVVALDSNELHARAGVVGKAPRASIAYKFAPKEATTTVKDIIVQVGRTGVLTPVAMLEPVKVGGVTISRATLHNEDEIRRLGLKIGDTVIVGRAGDVIPDVRKVLPELRTGKEKEFHMPKRCPICHTPVERDSGGVLVRCVNKKCPRLRFEILYHFVSKGAFDIDGLGPKTINVLLDQGLIQDPADLFLLKEGDISVLERYGERSAANIIAAVGRVKKISLPRFLVALGILHVGEETAIDIGEHFGTLENIMKANMDEIRAVRNIGDVVAKSISSFFRDKYYVELVKKLKRVGIEVKHMPRRAPGEFTNKSFVFTGELESITREEAKARVRALGGDVLETVSKNTDYVVAGASPGSKYDKAKKLGVRILDEKEFLKLIS